MDSDASHHRRIEPRLHALNLVNVARFDAESFQADAAIGRTVDLSEHGARLEVDHPLPVGSTLELTLALDADLLTVSAQLRHCELDPDERCFIGLHFVDLSEEALEEIRTYLLRHAKRG